MNTQVHENPKIYGSYAAEVENVKRYIRERIKWMDKKLEYSPKKPEEPKEPDTPTATDEIRVKDVSVRAHSGKINIEGITAPTRVEIFNSSGTCLFSNLIYGNDSFPFPKGIYIVRLTGSTGAVNTVKVGIE